MTMSAAQLLDELMGSNRNLAPSEKTREIRFDDSEVCKHFLCGFCPCDLFTNTRADLGTCTLVHDEELRRKYKAAPRYEKLGYEEDFCRQLQSLLSDVDKRIRKGQARLALNASQGNLMGGPHMAREEKAVMLTDKINELVEQAEVLGCEGKVEEAQGVMKLCEQLQEERTHLQTIEQRQQTGTGKEMEVCNICGALLVVGDAQQRIDEHIMGKQHMGYAQIRSYVEGYKARKNNEEQEREDRLKKEREEREKEREQEREDRQKEREEREKLLKEREREREKEREDRRRRRSRSRDRDRRRRTRSRERRRSRSRSRSRKRSRSRDRDSRRRRSRDRHSGRDRDRRRSRSRSHSKKSRDRSKDRGKSKERSRDRDRSRDRERSDRSPDRDRSKDREKSRDSSDDHKKRDRSVENDKLEEKDMEIEDAGENNHASPSESCD